MDKLEQIKETIEGSAELLDKQPEYNFHTFVFDEFIRIIQENDYDYDRIKSVRLNHEDWIDTTYLDPRLYNNRWYPDTDVRYYWDRQYRTTAVPIWRTNTQTTTSVSDAVVATPRNQEE